MSLKTHLIKLFFWG